MAESYEAGRRVRMPAGAERPIHVFINGTEQREGEAYSIHDELIVFTRPIIKERVGRGRWLAMTLGLFGSYGENETVDVHFTRGGKTEVISDARILD
ncbi:MAG TPA: hypothetical protein VFN15_06490 [Solirubrobacterales bacterium]|nr:hypothetical protein [Solirubrobacterales bacterium]